MASKAPVRLQHPEHKTVSSVALHWSLSSLIMSPHATSHSTNSPLSETGSLPHVRALKRSPSNLSQVSTLVGTESDDDDSAGPRLSAASQHTAHHDVTRTNGAQQPAASHRANLDARGSAPERTSCNAPIRQLAQERMRALHALCDPVIDKVNDVNIKLGEAERVWKGGDHLTAHQLYEEVLRDIGQVMAVRSRRV
jgi:hypothetical protein